MAVDSVGNKNAADAQYKLQKKTLEDERNRELERVEKQFQEQVRKTQESRDKSLQDIYESQSGLVEGRQRDADRKIERAKEASDQRIKAFETESQRLAEEAQRQFQAKASNLSRNAEELEKQRKHLIAQHSDSMKHVREEHDKAERESSMKANRLANEAYINSQRKLSSLQARGELELQAMNDEFRERKAGKQSDAEMELLRIQNQRDLNRQSLNSEIELQSRAGKEKEEYQRITNEKNLANRRDDFDSQMRDINRSSRFQINSEIMKSRRDMDDTRGRFSEEQRLLNKQHEQRILQSEMKNQEHVTNIEDEAKLREHMTKKAFHYRQERFKEEAEKNLTQYAEQNEKLRGNLESNYRTQSANLKDKYAKQFGDQEHQLQHELKHQYVRGTSQINNLMLENAKDQMYVQKKSEDPFYRVQRLNPTLHDVGDEYIVNLKMPAHEQEHVRLSHQKGQLTVSNNRRFEAQSKTEEGQSVSTSAYQSYSESLPITGRVDITKMRRSYSDGILTFRLPKILV